MSKISQRQSVELETINQLGDRFRPGVDVKTYVTKEDRSAIALAVAQAMLDGKVELSQAATEKYATSLANLKSKYVAGMVTNWFNKSLNLNGGVPYKIKSPGSRSKDIQDAQDIFKLDSAI